MKRLTFFAIIFAVATVAGCYVSGCAGAQAPVTVNPTPSQVDATRRLAIQIADGMDTAVAAIRVIRQACQDQTVSAAHPTNPISVATMNQIDADTIALAQTLQHAADSASQITGDPSLGNTLRPVFDQADTYLNQLPRTGALQYLVPLAQGGLATLKTKVGL
jgi:hypothetical protein